jgi:hypothetical protein
MYEVQRHPSKADTHEQRFLFCVMTREVEGAFAAKEVTIKALLFARVLNGEFDMSL